MSKINDRTGEYNISGLAEVSGISIRNIRAYRARNLLQAPERRGRSSIYTQAHVTRLRTITRLLGRGYTMSNIEELLNAWHAGDDIAELLGLDAEAGPDAPTTVTIAELHKLLGDAVTPALIERAVAGGYAQRRGTQVYLPRPTLLYAAAELVKMGVPLDSLLDITEQLTKQLDIATGLLVDSLTEEAGNQQDAPDAQVAHVAEMASRLRGLFDRVVASEVGDSLHRTLEARFGEVLPKAEQTQRLVASATRD